MTCNSHYAPVCTDAEQTSRQNVSFSELTA